jgi:putative intracellular protease/amidase
MANNYESCEMCNFEIHKSILMVVSDTAKLKDGSATGVWLEEYAIPYSAFIDRGYEVTTASPNGGQIPIDPQSDNDKWEIPKNSLKNVRRLCAVDYPRYSAIIIIGGHGAMFDLYNNEVLGKILNEFDNKNKLIGAICHGPAGLLSAPNIVKNRKLTCFTNEEEFYANKENNIPYFLEDALKTLGALFVQGGIGEVNVVEDKNLITAQNYCSTGIFTKKILEYLENN